jgi:nucleoside-diphosphate-sugar epimerase
VDRFLQGETPLVYGDGEQYRDFVYVANVVEANLLAGRVPTAAGRCYNIGCGRRTTLNDLLRILGRLVGREVSPRHADARPGDIRESVADISRAQAELGYEPLIDVEEGLRRLLAHETHRRGT